jgi:hypothetical protein
MNGDLTVLDICALMAWKGTNLPFMTYHRHEAKIPVIAAIIKFHFI